MKASFHITTTFLLITVFASAQDTWVRKADFGSITRNGVAGFSIGSKGYVGTGFSGEWLKDFWEYDPVTNVWTQKADFTGIARSGATGFSVGNKGYLGTGENGDEWPFTFTDFWEYDPAANTWTRKADLPSSRGRYTAISFSLGAKGYVGLGSYFGYYDPFCFDDFWEYDPAVNTWTKKADFGGGERASAIAFTVDNKGYVGTGSRFEEIGGSTIYTRYKDLWEYDPVTNLWINRADLPSGERFSATGFSVLNKGYLTAGYDVMSGQTKKDVWEYDPAANTWLQKTDYPGFGDSRLTALNINNKAYVGLGSSAVDFWEYNPASSTDTCASPTEPVVVKVTTNTALLTWNIPIDTPANYKIRYRAAADTTILTRRTKGSNNRLHLSGLKPNTKYQWQIKSMCALDTNAWVKGPDFITACLNATTKLSNDIALQQITITPNPGNGDFVLQVKLPSTPTATIAYLYASDGMLIWMQQLGNISNTFTKNFDLSNKLRPGVYIFQLKRNDLFLSRTVIVSK